MLYGSENLITRPHVFHRAGSGGGGHNAASSSGILNITGKCLKSQGRNNNFFLSVHLSQRDFAKYIFISHDLLGKIELGKRNINERIIHLITEQFKVNKAWLLSGQGEMFLEPPPDLQFEKLSELFAQLNKPLRDCLLEQLKSLLKFQKENMDR